jgi:hypothetical protein
MVILIVENIVQNKNILKNIKRELGCLLEENLLDPFIYKEEDNWQYLSQVMPIHRMITLLEIQEIAIKKKEREEVISKIKKVILSNILEKPFSLEY